MVVLAMIIARAQNQPLEKSTVVVAFIPPSIFPAVDSFIVAANSGTVILAGWDNSGYGNLIIVDHGNSYWTYYAHNSELHILRRAGYRTRPAWF